MINCFKYSSLVIMHTPIYNYTNNTIYNTIFQYVNTILQI
uniref:Uncharacterized protein n=1 Tax=Myoviridae sp. ctuAx8 TaxID=2825199 RepID=A0A8S5PZD2_9CAUD|nr:MAG TPA: hypothetical protein [Myoviridae sp. ctuAx8]